MTYDMDVTNSPVKNSDASPIDEHPDAKEIRRQVEYWFSDENLATDEHLQALLCGPDNLPVSLGQILGWKRMRQYKPKRQVIEALKRCTTVKVINDSRLQRVVPYLVDATKESGGIATIPGNRTKTIAGQGVKAGYEIRNGVVAKIEAKTSRVTGFEDEYTEGSLRSVDQMAENDKYRDDVPISNRVEIGIFHFVSRRKFDNVLRHAFDRFLRFGGIDIAPPSFRGRKEDLKNADAHYVAQMLGHHSAPRDALNASKYDVDFLAVAQCYLGSHVLNHLDDIETDATCKVMVNFYNYLLLHNVCPEYSSQICAAKELVTKAQIVDIPMARRSMMAMPGQFNEACNALFGESCKVQFQQLRSVRLEDLEPVHDSIECGTEQAKTVFFYAALALGSKNLTSFLTDGTQMHKWIDTVRTIVTAEATLEVVDFQAASIETKALYASIESSTFKPQPVGKLVCRRWNADLFTYYDMPKGFKPTSANPPSELLFWMEDSVLTHVKAGIRLQGQIRLLSVGDYQRIWVLERVSKVFCAFYQPTLNELMVAGKTKIVRWRTQCPSYIVDQFGLDGHIDVAI